MAEKRVSVRLAAVGGRQVRAELEGVGEAGARGFGRLGREMEAANARLAAFSRRVKLATAAAVAAAAAAGVAMVRSGLQTVDAQAKLAQSLGTTVASIQSLERAGELAGVSISGIEQATKDLTRRLSQAAAGTGPAADALDRLGLSATDLIALPLDQRVGAINAAIEAFVPAAEHAAVAGQLFGEEGSIAMSRIDSATLRQATEDVRAFGVVVSEADADQIERTNDAISRLGLIWRGLSNQLAVAAAPALEAVANAMAAVASRSGPLGIAIRGVFDNIGRLTAYATSFVAFLAGRWVAGMAAAALSVRGLATALVFLRGALIRTGIGALIVGAGELMHQFTQLVQGAGGFGDAMALLQDLALEVWERLRMGAAAAGAAATAMFFGLKADAAASLQSAIESVVGFGNTAANTFQGTFRAVQAIWEALPQVFDRIGTLAINGLVAAMEIGLGGITEALNTVLTLGGRRPDWALPAPDLSTWKAAVPEAVRLGTRARDAFAEAFSDAPLEVPDLGLGAVAREAGDAATRHARTARDLAAAATAPLTGWQKLRDAVTASGTAGSAAIEAAAASADRLDAALSKVAQTAGGGSKSGGRDTDPTGLEAAFGRLSDYAKDAMDWSKGLGEALAGAFQGAEAALRRFVEGGKLDFRGLVRSMLADLAMLALRRNVLGPIAGALAGVFGGGAVTAAVSHAGGLVGFSGTTRGVPALAFAGAPRLHAGGWAGLAPDEVPTILQRGERVLSRREVAAGGSAAGGTVDVRIFVDRDGSWRAAVERISGTVAAGVMRNGLDQYDREVLPARVGAIGAAPRRIG